MRFYDDETFICTRCTQMTDSREESEREELCLLCFDDIARESFTRDYNQAQNMECRSYASQFRTNN